MPTPTTWSAHWIADPRFRRAIERYLARRAGRGRAATGSPSADHLPFRRGVASRDDPVARRPGDCARRRFPPVDAALSEPNGLLARGRRPVAGAAAGRLPARHLSLVLGRPADPVVVPGSAGSASTRRVSCFAQPRPHRCAIAVTSHASTRAFAAVDRGLRRPRRCGPRAPGSRAECATPTQLLHELGLRAFGRDLARADAWSAASTAWRSAACSSANPCSARERDASKVALARLVEELRRARRRS